MPRIRVISHEVTPVQLTELLARLSADDRATLVERRLGPNAVPIDNRALAGQLANARSIAAALQQLNNGQILLLRWLAERPNLHASWTDFMEALGDRLPPELRDSYLQDVRLWGLADFDARARGGYFSTYPAVAAALPSGRDIRLRPRLEALNSDVLLKVCTALGLKNPPTRKEGRVNLLVAALTTTETVRTALELLSPAAQALFEWVRERGGWVGAAEMDTRVKRRSGSYRGAYGSIDTFWYPLAKNEKLDPLTELVRGMLVVPLTPYAGSWYAPSAYAIATEVERAYSGREILDSGPLQPPPIERAEQVDGTAPNPTNLLRDIGHLLGFIGAGRCEWRQDGQPYKRSLVALGKMLGHKDGTYAETLWGLASSAELVQPVYQRALPHYEPVPIDDLSALHMFSALILGWIKSGGAAVEAGTIPAQAQQARTRVVQLLGLLPADTWLTQASVDALLRFYWPVVFAPEYQIAGTIAPEPGWSALAALLVGYGSTPGGQPAVLVPAAYQRLLAEEPGDVEAMVPPWDSSWVVQPDRTIVVPPNAPPDALMDLWKVAQLQSSHGASVFRVTAESIAAALNQHVTPIQVREILQRGSRVPLPPTVERLIDDQGQRYGRIKVGVAHTYVRTDDPALLEELRRHKKLSKLTWQDVAPGVAFVVSDEPLAVLDTLRQAGYLPVMEESRQQALKRVPATAPLPRSASPRGGNGRRGGEPETISGRDALVRIVQVAIETAEPLTVTWLTRGLPYIAEIEVIDLHGDEVHAYNLDRDGQEVLIPLDAIVDVTADAPLIDDDGEEWP